MRNLLLMLCIALCFASCGGGAKADERPVLVVSIEPYRYMVEQVAGNGFRVVTLVPGSGSPESYEPTPQQMIDLINSRAYFASGYIDFERTRLPKITSDNPQFPVYNLSAGIRTLSDADGHGVDSHLWLSARNAVAIAQNICSAMCALDSTHAPLYRRRAAAFVARMDSIDRTIRSKTASLSRRSFLIYHPALTYFAHDYALRQMPVAAGGKEASPAHLEALIAQSRAERAGVIFVQKQFPADIARQLAREAGVAVVEINPLAYRFDEQLITIANTLAE